MTFRLLISSTFALASLHAAAPSKIEFNRDVRPILSENCFACHGFDPKHREGKLRLDNFEGATENRRWFTRHRAWKPEATRMSGSASPARIRMRLMPPPKSHKPPLIGTPARGDQNHGSSKARSMNVTGPSKPPHGCPHIRLHVVGAEHPIDRFIRETVLLRPSSLKPSPLADSARR
jgi:hypothetical protein